MLEDNLQVEREKRETEEFIEILKTLSEIEQAEVRGYIKGISSMKFYTKKLHSAEERIST